MIIRLLCALLLFGSAVQEGLAGIDDGGRAAVASARRRNQQVPLPPTEALAAAYLARQVGDRDAMIELLRRATSEGPLAEVARVELAEELVTNAPDEAVRLVIPTLVHEGSPQLFEAAMKVVVVGAGGPLQDVTRDALTKEVSRLSGRSRRVLEAILADPANPEQRGRMVLVLEKYPSDLAALQVARRLQTVTGLSDREQWLVARCYFWHALYEEAVERLGRLNEHMVKSANVWEVRFVRGRCEFRMDRFAAAADWYRKALAVVGDREDRAELLVHLARALELDGDVDGAVEAVRQAVGVDESDDRRLFLARLRLATGRRDLAEQGISRIRGATGRDRGKLLVALDLLSAGEIAAGRAMLLEIQRRPWRGPAKVVAARLFVVDGQPERALGLLQQAAPELDEFWAFRARSVLQMIPEADLLGWREQRMAEALGDDARTALKALRELAVLEPAGETLLPVRALVQEQRPLVFEEAGERVKGLAAELLAIGQEGAAGRWDPSGFPVATASETLWSAEFFRANGMPWRSIRTADAAWRMLGADLPLRVYPDRLEAAAYPETFVPEVRDAGRSAGLDWAIVAGVAREESRWDARVVSGVGARGLMQLMPGTALQISRRLERRPPTPDDLFDPAVSLTLGAVELTRLVAAFAGNVAPAVAAYNAGEAQSRLWLLQCGTNCDVDRFVLTISFAATRSYTEDVLATAEVHRRRLKSENAEPRVAPAPAPPIVQSLD